MRLLGARRGGRRRGPTAHAPLPERGRQRRRPHGVRGAHGSGPSRPERDRALPDRVGRARPPRQRRPRGLGARLQLRRPVVPEDRRLLERRLDLPSVLSPGGVLRRLRRVRRAAHAAARLRRRRHRPARGERANGDGSETFRFVQEDVHDFAWTASRRFVERQGAFRRARLPAGRDPPAASSPSTRRLAERYIEATRIALRDYGTWSAPYPYPQITVVDPAWGSASGGMEYPTLFTGGTHGPRAAGAAQPRGRDDPRGRPPVLVRARREQRVRGGLARRGLQHLHDREGHRPGARPTTAGADASSRRRLRPRRRTGWAFVAAGVRVPRGAE